MSSSIRFIVAAVALAMATAAHAGDRCEGTLCDLYYGNAPPPASAPATAAPTPMTVPSGNLFGGLFSGGDRSAAETAKPGSPATAQPTPGKAPMVSVGGGGVLGLARGAPAERCGGTFCDLFYGGPSPEEQREAQGAQTRPDASRPTTSGEALPPTGADGEPRPTRRRHGDIEYATERQEKPQCVAPPGDPWRCYRK